MIFIDFHRISRESQDFLDFHGFPKNAGPIFTINSLIKCFIRVQFSQFSKDFLFFIRFLVISLDLHRISQESQDLLDFRGFPEHAGPIFTINSLIKCFIRLQFSWFAKDFLCFIRFLLISCDFHRFPQNFWGILGFPRFPRISKKRGTNFQQ